MTPTNPTRRTWLRGVLRVAVAFGLLGLVAWLNRDQIQAVRSRPLDGRPYVLAFACYLAGLLLAFARWYLLVRAQGLPFRLGVIMRFGFIGNLYNLVIPGAVGGDFVKAAYLCRGQERKVEAVASIVVDRLVGLLGLFLLAGVTGLLAWHGLDPKARRLLVLVAILLAVVATALAAASSPTLYRLWGRRVARHPRRARRLAALHDMATAYRGRPAILAVTLVLATATHALNCLAFYGANLALYRSVPTLAEHFVLVPLVLFSTAVPLPLGALGLSEGVSAGLFRVTGFDGGAVAMMAFRVLQYAGAVISAVVYLPSRRQVQSLVESAKTTGVGS